MRSILIKKDTSREDLPKAIVVTIVVDTICAHDLTMKPFVHYIYPSI